MKEIAMENELEHMCTNLDKSYDDWLSWWEDSYKLPSTDSEIKSKKTRPIQLVGSRWKANKLLTLLVTILFP